jgi:hypothetical protein
LYVKSISEEYKKWESCGTGNHVVIYVTAAPFSASLPFHFSP